MHNIKNSVRLIGFLGANPEIKDLGFGRKLARFTVATTEKHVDREGKGISDTQWHNVIAYDKTAEIIEEFFTKGTEVALEGKLTSRSYEGKDGDKKYITEIQVNEILLLGKNPQF